MKHKGYSAFSELISTGNFDSFSDIFKCVPTSVLANDIHVGNRKIKTLKANPWKIKLGQVMILAEKLGVNPERLVDIIVKEFKNRGTSLD